MKRTLVIGDVHGHADRLRALLLKAGVAEMHSHGMTPLPQDEAPEIVQLGDLGHFGGYGGTRQDYECYQIALDTGMIVLWGNHDRYAIDPVRHFFKGAVPPTPELYELMSKVHPKLSHVAHGYLLTHAGLHPYFAEPYRNNADALMAMICADENRDVVNAISPTRGGTALFGGILWRDAREPLALVPQIFGHTRGGIRRYGESWCIDVGGHKDGNLMGIWLPDLKIVAVGEDAEQFEKYPAENL